MRTVWKYGLLVSDTTTVRMPPSARVLRIVPTQVPDELTLWAEVNPDEEPDEQVFHVHGTGHPIPADGRTHVATVPTPHGLVWHVYRALPGAVMEPAEDNLDEQIQTLLEQQRTDEAEAEG